MSAHCSGRMGSGPFSDRYGWEKSFSGQYSARTSSSGVTSARKSERNTMEPPLVSYSTRTSSPGSSGAGAETVSGDAGSAGVGRSSHPAVIVRIIISISTPGQSLRRRNPALRFMSSSRLRSDRSCVQYTTAFPAAQPQF